jgi:predicted transcriptional regulator
MLKASRKRGSSEIVAEILKVARKGAKKTRIVYGANLNFKMLNEYITKLEEAGLITGSKDGDRLIHTTERGMEFLERFQGLEEFGID